MQETGKVKKVMGSVGICSYMGIPKLSCLIREGSQNFKKRESMVFDHPYSELGKYFRL